MKARSVQRLKLNPALGVRMVGKRIAVKRKAANDPTESK